MTTTATATPLGALRARIAALEALADRVDAELTDARRRLTRVQAIPVSRTSVPTGTDAGRVREWAAAHGWPDVADKRGRLPAAAITAYLTANR